MTDPLAPERLQPPTPGQLRRLMGAERLRPRKSLSQHFLTDPVALDAIVEAAELQPGDRVVEIGPGLGVLTRRLLAAGTSVIAVELDPRLASWLRRELGEVENFELIEADALSLHPRDFFAGEPYKVVANIPYSITSPLLHAFLEGERPPDLMVVLVQLEVAERVAAAPGSMSYLSAFAQNVASAEVVARVPADAFEPAPEVDSAVLRLRRRPDPVVPVGERREPFYRVVQAAFRQRRKQIHNGLVRELPASRDDRGRRARAVRRRRRATAPDAQHRGMGLPGIGARERRVTPFRLEAPAKLNLSLRVVGRRDDGFHLLDSELILLELADRLILLPGSNGLRVDGDAAGGVPLDARNLAWRGLRAGLGREPDLVCLALEKRVPAAAGLGGGSSDAAAGWRLGRASRGVTAPADAAELDELSTIGADVPFFAAEVAAARVGGIGERVEPVAAPIRHVVLLHPTFGLSTADVFAELRPDEWGSGPNDLLPAARRLRPELDALFALVVAAGGSPRLTGSGPTIFTLADDAESAAAIAGSLERAGARATVTRTRESPAAIEAIDDEEA